MSPSFTPPATPKTSALWIVKRGSTRSDLACAPGQASSGPAHRATSCPATLRGEVGLAAAWAEQGLGATGGGGGEGFVKY